MNARALPLLSWITALVLAMPLPAQDKPLEVELLSHVDIAAPATPFQVSVRLKHGQHWHTYGKTLPEDVIGKPTKLKWKLPEGWSLRELPWPETHQVPSTDGKTSVGYDGVVDLPAEITAAGKPGDEGLIEVEVDALACDPKSCRPVKAKASLSVKLAQAAQPKAGTTAPHPPQIKASAEATTSAATPGSLGLGALLIGLLGGLILNVMPCVFPVLGIKVLAVVEQAGQDRRQVLKHALAYSAGVVLCFWVLGAVVIALGKAWGFQLQSPGFVFGLCLFFLIFGLNMAGLFEVGSSAVAVGSELQQKHGMGGSFFSGLLAVVVATPCSAPFLGSALGFALSLPALQGMLMFTSIALGLASPFLLLALFPALLRALPRPGAWMESFKQGLSFLLFATTAYLLWVLSGMLEGQDLLFSMLALVAAAMACWVYGRWCLPHRSSKARRSAGLVATALLALALSSGWPRQGSDLPWEAWSPQRVEQLLAEGRPVYIDYTAKWCVTCQVNKRVYHDSALRELIRNKRVALLRADWTQEDPRITAALDALGKAAVPVNVLLQPGANKPQIFPELLSADALSEAFKALP